MIKFIEPDIENFIKFLNQNYPSKNDVELTILPKDIDVGNKEDKGGFYVPENKEIIIMLHCEMFSNNDWKLQLIATIAHEYKHFLIEEEGKKQSEKECDKFAYKAVKEFTNGEYYKYLEE